MQKKTVDEMIAAMSDIQISIQNNEKALCLLLDFQRTLLYTFTFIKNMSTKEHKLQLQQLIKGELNTKFLKFKNCIMTEDVGSGEKT